MVSTALIAIEDSANLLVIAGLITLLAGLVHRALMGLRVLLTDLSFDYQFHNVLLTLTTKPLQRIPEVVWSIIRRFIFSCLQRMER